MNDYYLKFNINRYTPIKNDYQMRINYILIVCKVNLILLLKRIFFNMRSRGDRCDDPFLFCTVIDNWFISY
jgi:hypothetical protein